MKKGHKLKNIGLNLTRFEGAKLVEKFQKKYPEIMQDINKSIDFEMRGGILQRRLWTSRLSPTKKYSDQAIEVYLGLREVPIIISEDDKNNERVRRIHEKLEEINGFIDRYNTKGECGRFLFSALAKWGVAEKVLVDNNIEPDEDCQIKYARSHMSENFEPETNIDKLNAYAEELTNQLAAMKEDEDKTDIFSRLLTTIGLMESGKGFDGWIIDSRCGRGYALGYSPWRSNGLHYLKMALDQINYEKNISERLLTQSQFNKLKNIGDNFDKYLALVYDICRGKLLKGGLSTSEELDISHKKLREMKLPKTNWSMPLIYENICQALYELSRIKKADLSSKKTKLKDAIDLCKGVFTVIEKCSKLHFVAPDNVNFAEHLEKLGCVGFDDAAPKFKIYDYFPDNLDANETKSIRFPLACFTLLIDECKWRDDYFIRFMERLRKEDLVHKWLEAQNKKGVKELKTEEVLSIEDVELE